MADELWKAIEGYESYMVSNLGRVKHILKGGKEIIKKQYDNGHGYLKVGLSKFINGKQCGKSFGVHRLVAKAFIPNPNNYPEVNHKDENKANNCVDNLEWCTRIYNVNYGTGRYRRGLAQSETQKKKVICEELNIMFNSLNEAGAFINSSGSAISHCISRKSTAGGYHWHLYEGV